MASVQGVWVENWPSNLQTARMHVLYGKDNPGPFDRRNSQYYEKVFDELDGRWEMRLKRNLSGVDTLGNHATGNPAHMHEHRRRNRERTSMDIAFSCIVVEVRDL